MEIELAIPLSFQTIILKFSLNLPSSMICRIVIHQNQCVTDSSGVWVNLLIKDRASVSHTSENSSMDRTQFRATPERDHHPNHDSTTSVIMRFNTEGWVVPGAFQISTHPVSLFSVHLDFSESVRAQETYSFAQEEEAHLCRLKHTQRIVLPQHLHCEGIVRQCSQDSSS
ncbi:hypothetical protein TNCV_4231331 [Trichonephila clavipes]|uniref:Uncharacterized protein n=1 Tax=Trichonephila clavipes TaxID=2585209 RepID=A0A8X6VLC7_TRICX|nr:hypothetical protein TNCV_4231331 [Trichonephila clavipes]